MERLAILDHESHNLIVDDVSDETLQKYDGEEEKYIEDNYSLNEYSWEWISYTQYFKEDSDEPHCIDFKKIV